jgi:hypothetical protein
MDQGPLVSAEIDAGADLGREFDKRYPVKAAFWLKASDEEQRYLYIASDQINDSNLRMAYGEVLRLTRQMQSPDLDPFRVKLIGGENPLARAAVDIQRRFPGRMGTRFGGKTFGGLNVDDVHIYPMPIPAAVS